MKFNLNGVDTEIPGSDMLGVAYPNDLMNGLYIDRDDTYIFLSAHDTRHQELIARISEAEPDLMGADLTDVEVDINEQPHLFVVSRLGKIIVEGAEDLLETGFEMPPEPTERERLETKLKETMLRATDMECSYTIRQEAWKEVDDILDEIKKLA